MTTDNSGDSLIVVIFSAVDGVANGYQRVKVNDTLHWYLWVAIRVLESVHISHLVRGFFY